MKIGYFVSNLGVSGGVRVVSQHVKVLRQAGYDAILISPTTEEKSNLSEEVVVPRKETPSNIPACDIYVGTHFSDLEYLFQRVRGKVVHLCQGYEPLKYMARIKGEFVPEKYERESALSLLKRYVDIMKYRRKIKRVESVYTLPTVKAAVSKHLVELIEKNYKQRCFLVQNGIDSRIFYPGERRVWGKDGTIRILSVGSMHVGFKGIEDTLEAVKLLKDRGVNVELIRVSFTPPSRKELDGKTVDKFYQGLHEKEIGDLYRNIDIFVSSSMEMEGFGLPAMEALASGVPSVLTEISSYKNFDETKDFAFFVPTHRPDKIAEGVLTFMEDTEFREKCIKSGLEVAKNYTLEITRDGLLNLIKELM